MTSIVFTLCSNNYLAHAKTLGDSLLSKAPGTRFIIGLVDKRHPEVDYNVFRSFDIIGYDEIDCPEFSEMILRYNVVEFNTAVKPFYFEHLFKKYGRNSVVYYVDPDIVFYSGLAQLNEILGSNNFVITPHLTMAHENILPNELAALRDGLYNLGFIGIKHSDESLRFLKWWQDRLKTYCVIDRPKGLFVDQIWINFLPIMFRGVCVLGHLGYNMAWWNITERKLISRDDGYYVNDEKSKLVFFHFSGFKPGNNKRIGRISNPEFTFEARPDLSKIFSEYEKLLIGNSYFQYSRLKLLLGFAGQKSTLKQRIGRSLKFRTGALIKKYFNI
jgi:hypothetical protein